MKFGSFFALFLAAWPAFADTTVGVTNLIESTDVERPLEVTVWYPSEEPPTAVVGGNPVFEGVRAAVGAQSPNGPLPLVIMSHGGLRSATDSGAWLSASIAEAGYIVVEVNAPRAKTAAGAVDEIWRRPDDIRRTIDLMLGDPAWASRIDQKRVAVAGLSLGATAALSLAGGKLDIESYMQSCSAAAGSSGPDCGWYAAQNVTLSQTNQDGLAQMSRDPRISVVIALNPEYLSYLGAPASEVDTLLMVLGQDDGSGEAYPATKKQLDPEGSMLDAFAKCTKAGPAILAEEDGDVSMCGDSAERREAVHREISEAIVAFLASTVK